MSLAMFNNPQNLDFSSDHSKEITHCITATSHKPPFSLSDDYRK